MTDPTKFLKAYHNDATVCEMVKRGDSLEEIITKLSEEKQDLIQHICKHANKSLFIEIKQEDHIPKIPIGGFK
jgi:hypothetical protein